MIERVSQWLIPYALYVRLREAKPARPSSESLAPPHLRGNASLKGIHAGRRAFIVCNGPSINQQNLLLLRNELVFTVSGGYHHPHYLDISPRYHCVPQISSPKMSRADKIAWLREMDTRTGGAEIFLSDTEAPLVEDGRLFQGRKVRYLSLTEPFEAFPAHEIIDISRRVPGVQSVPIMCLMIAIYMGLSPIYLVGTEHDHFRTGKYEYFYKPELLRGTDPGVTAEGVVMTPLYDEFESLFRLWNQYRRLREIAEANGISILNATAGGALDEFPRVSFESQFFR